jgi:hypothetical protein
MRCQAQKITQAVAAPPVNDAIEAGIIPLLPQFSSVARVRSRGWPPINSVMLE